MRPFGPAGGIAMRWRNRLSGLAERSAGDPSAPAGTGRFGAAGGVSCGGRGSGGGDVLMMLNNTRRPAGGVVGDSTE